MLLSQMKFNSTLPKVLVSRPEVAQGFWIQPLVMGYAKLDQFPRLVPRGFALRSKSESTREISLLV